MEASPVLRQFAGTRSESGDITERNHKHHPTQHPMARESRKAPGGGVEGVVGYGRQERQRGSEKESRGSDQDERGDGGGEGGLAK